MRPSRFELADRLDVDHVARHFDDPQAAVGVPVDRDGILDHRLADDELEPVAGRQVERLHRRFGRQRRRRVSDALHGRRPRPDLKRISAHEHERDERSEHDESCRPHDVMNHRR